MCKLDQKEKEEKKKKGENYRCKKCGEKAGKEKYLCKPEEL